MIAAHAHTTVRVQLTVSYTSFPWSCTSTGLFWFYYPADLNWMLIMLWVFRSVINGLENSLLNTKSLVYTMLGQRLICCKALLSFLIRRQNNTGTTKGGNCIFSVDASYLCDLCPFYSCITLIIDLFFVSFSLSSGGCRLRRQPTVPAL